MWLIVTTLVATMTTVVRAQQVPCYFIFGDSILDNGNNNNLITRAKVNYSPYGIDFPNGPTGRFSNGRNIADFIAEYMGFQEPIPPFTASSPTNVQSGLNYASGGAGIREESGQNLGDRISFGRQIQRHRSVIANDSIPRQHLNECLYTIYIGSNDYINNYFTSPPYLTGFVYTPDQYADSLIRLYGSYLKILYDLGARKIAVFGIPRIGCLPRVVTTLGRGGNGCVEAVNDAARLFNQRLRALVDDLNNSLTRAKLTFVDTFGGDVSTFAALGITVSNQSCCTVQPGQDLCEANRPVCVDRTKYIFWDGVHSTEVVNELSARSAFSGATASPYSINTLATS